MQSVDGDVKLSVSMDTSDVMKDSQALKREIDSIFNSGPNGSIKFESLKTQMKQTALKASELSSKLSSIKASQVPTKEYAQLESTLSRTESKFDELYNKQERLQAAGITYGKEWDTIQSKMEKVSATIETTRNKMLGMRQAGTAYTPGVDTPEYSKVNSQLDATNDKMRLLIKRHAELASQDSDKVLSKTTNSLKRLHKSSNKAAMGIGRMIKMSILMSFAFKALMLVQQGIVQGFTNLAQYSESTNADLSALKSSLTQLKNSFATAFAPILSVVTPILTGFIRMLSTVINYIGMFIAALTGKGTFTKAVAVQENYAAGLEKTAGAAKDAKKAEQDYLSGLDEVAKFQEDKSSSGAGGGGAGAGGVDPSQMFEEVEIPNKLTALAEKVKKLFEPIIKSFIQFGRRIKKVTSEWWKNLDWGPLQTSVEKLISSLSPLVDLILNGLAWAYENVLLPLGKWTIEKGLPAIISALASSFELLAVVIQALTPAFQFLWDYLLKPLGALVLQITEDMIKGCEGVIIFLKGVFTGDWNTIFEGLGMVVQSFYDIVSGIFNFLQTVILEPFDKFMQTVFSVDYVAALGVIGQAMEGFLTSSQQIYESVKLALQGLINFITGVFTGDWGRAWQGIKQIFKGVFDTFTGIIRAPINGVIGMINTMISGIISGINAVIRAINRIHFNIPSWVPSFGGKSLGFHLSSVTAPRIPYLARGAVIPPNAPFMAMLGDQKNGTNVEAPLETIKQAVMEVLAGNGDKNASYQFVAQINRRTLFDEVIDEAKLRQTITASNPFLLGRA